jgi:thymidine phosphorylase
MVEAQGGRGAGLERDDALPCAPVRTTVSATRSSTLAAIDTFALGEVVVAIGGGRRAKEDDVDPRVGLLVHARIGDAVRAGQPLAEIHLAHDDPGVAKRVAACFTFEDRAVDRPALVLERVD